MTGSAPDLPEQFRSEPAEPEFSVSELMSEAAGAHSPFGNTEFPLPTDQLTYKHPEPANRPNLADGR